MFIPEVKSKSTEDISILIKLDNHSFNYICECGDASALTVKDCQNTRAIFISHTHIDHFINFDFILRHQIGTGKRVIVCGPEGITKQIQAKIKAYQWNLISSDAITYEIREIRQEQQVLRAEIIPPLWEIKELEPINDEFVYSNEIFDVSVVILDHKTDSISYLFKEKNTLKINLSQTDFKGGPWVRTLMSAYENNLGEKKIMIDNKAYQAKDLFQLMILKEGDSLGIIMDHAANEANHAKIKVKFTNCNKVFIESFYKEEDKEFATLNYHSYTKASAKIMKACNVETAIPVHFSRKYNEEDLVTLLSEFHEAFSL